MNAEILLLSKDLRVEKKQWQEKCLYQLLYLLYLLYLLHPTNTQSGKYTVPSLRLPFRTNLIRNFVAVLDRDF
ncbi:hypothetical protein GCM10009647_075280 [Streptomyces sanglieri]